MARVKKEEDVELRARKEEGSEPRTRVVMLDLIIIQKRSEVSDKPHEARPAMRRSAR
jgi:hypothetical protein